MAVDDHVASSEDVIRVLCKPSLASDIATGGVRLVGLFSRSPHTALVRARMHQQSENGER